MRSKSSPSARPSAASALALPNVGDPVWARVDSFPWWPGRIVSREQLALAPDEPEPNLRPAQMLVQFFNDNNRFEVMDRKSVKMYYVDTADKVNKGYDGPYAFDLRDAIAEMKSYANDIGWFKNKADAAPSPAKQITADAHSARRESAGASQSATDNTADIQANHPASSMAVDDDDAPNPVLTDVEDVRTGVDAEDVEFVFNSNADDDHVDDDGFLVPGGRTESNMVEPQMVEQSVDNVDNDTEVICLDGDNAKQHSDDMQQVDHEERPAAQVRDARQAVASANGRVSQPNGNNARQDAETTPSAAVRSSRPSQPASFGEDNAAAADGSEVVAAPRKEPHSDDTSTESMPINSSTAKQQSGGSAAQSSKRKVSQFQGDESAPTSKGGADAARPRKRKKKSSPEPQAAVAQKRKSPAVAKTNRSEGTKGADKHARVARPKKSTKTGAASGSVADKGANGSKAGLTDLSNALRRRDEQIAAMQTRLERLEGEAADTTGQNMVRNGMELVQPAKDMLKSAQDMLKSAYDMIMEGQEMMRKSG